MRLFLAVLPAVLFLTSCDQRPKAARAPATPAKNSKGPVEPRFKAARAQILEGKFAEAAAALAELDEESIRQPLHNWITLHEGMALLLAGRDADARAAFGKVEDRGLYSKDERDKEVANFFVNVAHLLRTEEAVPGELAKDYDKWTFEGLALLLLALKDWGMDKYEEAVPLFRQFDSVMPEKMVEWASGPEDLQKLKKIAQDCATDFTELRPALEALKAASTPEQQVAAVEAAKAARAKTKLVTKRSQELDVLLAELGPKATAAMAEKNRMSAEEDAADTKAFTDAKTKRTELVGKYLFADARSAILDPALKGEKLRDEQQLLAKKTQWLANFKSQLMEDLNAKGYSQQIKTKAGTVVVGAIVKADDQQLYLKNPRGLVPMPWTELSQDTVYDIGASFILPDMPEQIAGFRKWHLGVFASFAGKTKESQALLTEAAQLKPLFAEELPLFAPGVKAW